jgi:hypothetical protein
MLLGLVSGAGWFATFLIAHLGVFHFLRLQNRFKCIARLFVAASLGHLATIVVLQQFASVLGDAFGGPALSFCAGLMTMLCLFVIYMPFYFTIAASLSVQSMILIDRSPGRTLPVADLHARFASRKLLAQRLATMVANGYLVPAEDGFRLTFKGRFVGRAFQSIKRLWRLGAGG